ncbi:response regulator [bacterium]|nr:response regulator [bacterium]
MEDTAATIEFKKKVTVKQAKILLVDDNREFLSITRDLLHHKTGYEIITLEYGVQAVEVAREEMPDVIVLDVFMPDIEGPEICRAIKSQPDLRDIPVLFLTGGGVSAHFKARCLEEGADDFLMKPTESEELIARLQVLLRIKNLQDELRAERDALEIKVQERARELQEKETLAAIGKMVAGVAHEIRNPLGAISNSAAVLSRDLVLEGEDLKLMDIIVRESDRLRLIINNFLKFAHPAPYHFVALDIRSLIDDVVMLARRDSLFSDEIELEVQYQDALDLIEIDQDRIHQVLWNMLRNALEALHGKGKITISVSQTTGEVHLWTKIRLADDGPGIPEAMQQDVFAPFFTTKARGSGLGLAMVASAIRAHNGSIALSSGEGEGTEFIIELPVKQHNMSR